MLSTNNQKNKQGIPKKNKNKKNVYSYFKPLRWCKKLEIMLSISIKL